MRNLLIVGAGGFGKEVAWTALAMNRAFSDSDRWQLIGFADDDPKKVGCEIFSLPVLGSPEQAVARLSGGGLWYHCATGCNSTRAELAERLDKTGASSATLIHPSAVVAPHVEMGEGCYVGALTVINPEVSIGRHVLINQRVAIGHDAVLGDFCQINPGGQVNGACRVGELALVGSNASLHPGVRIGARAVVGANSQVLRDVPDNTTVNGVPCVVSFGRRNQPGKQS